MPRMENLLQKFLSVRAVSEKICKPLEIDDYNMQAMVYGSPPKWNLGHCTWAFEAFVLQATVPAYRLYNDQYPFLFNSYYETVGKRVQRDRRYLMSRPTVSEVYRYRAAVDETIESLMTNRQAKISNIEDFLMRLEIAINHEQQHQELFFTDLKHIFFESPLQPAYQSETPPQGENESKTPALNYAEYGGTIAEIGCKHDQDNVFSYDNERGRHQVYLNPFGISNRPVTNGEYIEFLESGGYADFQWWLSDAWAVVQKENWTQPLYWEHRDGEWHEFTLYGWKKIDHQAPVCHVSYFEANAFASYSGARLPSEFEWEYVASNCLDEISQGHFMNNQYYHPVANALSAEAKEPSCFFGNTWEWTNSSYLPYPHFQTPPGALAEYNGKFMNSQRVLRGGSCVTPRDHIRLTYRNFFEPYQRWQFAGFRLAKDI